MRAALLARRRAAAAFALSGAGLLLAACGSSEPEAVSGPDLFDGDRALRDVAAQVEIGPRPSGSPASREEIRFIVRELGAAGVEDIQVQRSYANVVGTIPGREPGAVVMGAHHDTKDSIEGFVGANDAASGVAVVLELARSLEAPVDGPSIHLALFDAEEARGDRPFEEDGTRGSRQYVELASAGGGQGAPALDEITAMVLFDLVGDCDLQIPREPGSDEGLFELFAEGAEEATGAPEPFAGTTDPILDDHMPFVAAGIPAVDLIDLTYGGDSPGPFWHTAEDTLERVCADSLDVVGEAAVRAIPRIGSG